MTRAEMKKGKLGVTAWVLLLTLILVGGCDSSSEVAIDGPTANLVVRFEPNPATHFAEGEWKYTVYLSETAGIGVHIYGWVRQGYSAAGAKYAEDKSDEIDFIQEFRACGGEGNYLEAGSTRCSNRHLFDRKNSGWQTFTFFGVDDLGNEVTGEGRLDLL